jgi:hypothetical protein
MGRGEEELLVGPRPRLAVTSNSAPKAGPPGCLANRSTFTHLALAFNLTFTNSR